MIGPLAISIVLLSLSAAVISMAWVMTFQLTPERKRRAMLRWLRTWSAKGLLLPVVLWGLMNVGLSWRLQPFMPQVQAVQNSGLPWFPEWLRVTTAGLFVVGSYWATGTLIWVLVNTSRAVDPEPRKDFKALCLTCLLGLSIPALLVLLVGGWTMLGFAGVLIVAPMAGYAPGILQPQQLPPMYARAIARMKFGKYSEAELEIINELEKCEDDFEGWMMLAGLYANHFNDIAEAERTVLEICDQPRTTTSQLSVALHQLADWQLKTARDPEAARRALQMIVDRLKGTHLAHMAELRLNQLPKTAAELREQQAARPIPLPALGDSLDREEPGELPEVERRQAACQANECVEQLKSDPNSSQARERLARIFTEQLGRSDLGLEQLHLLLNMPAQPEGKRAEWLALAAAWYLKYRHDRETGRRFLQRLADEFPDTPHAFAARQRLERMKAAKS
jgi:hypothetical protein